MFVNHLCEAKSEQDGEANKAQESFAEFVIPSSDSPVALDSLEEVFYPMTATVELCGEWYARRAVTATGNAGFNSLGRLSDLDVFPAVPLLVQKEYFQARRTLTKEADQLYYFYCRSRESLSMEIIASAIFGRSSFTFGRRRMIRFTSR